LAEREPDPDGDRDEEQRDDERQAPAPVVEGLDAKVCTVTDDRPQGDDEAERRRRLEPPGVVAAMFGLDMLGDVGDGPPVLSAEAEPLDQAKAEEDEGRRQADRLVGGNEADKGGGHPHPGQRDDESVLATGLVAEPAKEERPQRSDEKADREDRHRAEEGRDGMTLLEELDRQDRGQAAEDVEVVPLDDVADGCSDDDTAQLAERNFSSPHWPPLV